MKRRERSESFYISSERIEEYKRELIPINRVITTIDEDDDDDEDEFIEKREVDPEISMLSHMVNEELMGRKRCNAKKKKLWSRDEEETDEVAQDMFADFNDINQQGNQVNGTEGEETVMGSNMEFAGLSCSSSSSSSSSSVIDTK